MRASLVDLVRPLVIDRLGRRQQASTGLSVSIVSLIVRGANVEFARCHDESAAQLERGQVLTDAILEAQLKGSVGAIDQMKYVVGISGEPAVRQKVVGPFPVGRVAV